MKKIFSFLLAMSISVSMLANVVTGTCGEHLNWSYDSDTYVLDITGYGAMSLVDRPWDQVASQIETVNLPDDNSVITYTASEKLPETTSQWSSGLHTESFNASIISHTFKDGIGTITFDGNLTYVGDYAFYNSTNLTAITIPESVTSIGNGAFADCFALTSFTIPSSVTSIGNDAFYHCTSLPSVTFPNSVMSIGQDAFSGCSSITSITTPVYLTSIEKSTFSGCTNLTSVTISNAVTSIGEDAFGHCEKLSSVTIGSSVTSIGISAFGNSGLTSITIPSSVMSIGTWFLGNCPITSITCETTTPPTCESGSFYSMDPSMPLYVPCGSVEAYQAADGWKDFTNIQPIAGSCDPNQSDEHPEYNINVESSNNLWGEAAYRIVTIEIWATPLEGYHFVEWSDGNTEAIRVINLTGDLNLTAIFEEDSPNALVSPQPQRVAIKYINNGQLLVQRDGKTYNMQGAVVE